MAFHFKLAPLLRLRQSVERQRALRLQEASLVVVRCQEKVARLDRFLADSATSDEASLATGRRGAELQFASLIESNLHTLRRELVAELQDAENKRQGAAEEYQRAFREREALDTLRARQRRQYQQEAQRRTQRELDAAHLIQFWRKNTG
jgi:flagellar export protein FliJ